MSLRSKIVLILIAVVSAYALTTSQIQRVIFSDRFTQIEREGAADDVQRVAEALANEVSHVDQLCHEWSAWDDAYAFVRGERQSFERSSLSTARLATQQVDVLFFLSPPDDQGDHNIHWAHSVDPDSGDPVELRELNARWDKVSTRNPLLARGRWQGSQSEGTDRPVGIWLTEHMPLIVACRPILRSDGTGEPAGVLVLGRFLGEGLDERLTQQTRVEFDVWQAGGRSALPEDVAALKDEITASATPIVREASEEITHAWTAFNDIQHRPELLLRAEVARDISETGSVALGFGLISAIAGGFVLLFALMVLLQRIVIAPVQKLTSHAVAIGKTEDFRAKLGLEREDELGTLAGEFDSMMVKLESARAQVVETARTAGMSEIATGILHNVGNVLNSVNISASLVSQRVDGMSVTDLQKVAQILEDHSENLGNFISEDPKGKHLQPFLTALSVQLGEEQRTIAAEVGSLTDGIEHICELIKSQQEFAVKAELVEDVDLAEKIEEALHITDQAHGQDPDLQVTRSFVELPEIEIDKHRLLEILINLIQNARQAMSKQDERRLALSLQKEGEDMVRIEVTDTGTGISEENLAKVFNLGFTTKADGHGYGLHTAANAATEMGGHLTATSPGEGHGSTFVLTLPLRVAARAGDLQ